MVLGVIFVVLEGCSFFLNIPFFIKTSHFRVFIPYSGGVFKTKMSTVVVWDTSACKCDNEKD